MKVDRQEFLTKLQLVQPGLAEKGEVIEQSSCFVFDKGRVFTFNDEVACSTKSGLDSKVTIAVQSKPILSLMEKLPEDDLIFEIKEGSLLISGKGRKACLRCEAEILLSLDSVEEPTSWQELPESFEDAVTITAACAGNDPSRWALTCIHLNGKFLEALDNIHMARYKVKLAIPQDGDFLLRARSLKQITSLGVHEMSVTNAWAHFRSKSGLVLSCRKFEANDFPELAKIIDPSGDPITLPKGLAEAVSKAQIFTVEGNEDDKVMVELREGKMILKGEGTFGWYKERKPVVYKGPPMSFLISPSLLVGLTKKQADCRVAPNRIKVVAPKFIYIGWLKDAQPKEEATG